MLYVCGILSHVGQVSLLPSRTRIRLLGQQVGQQLVVRVECEGLALHQAAEMADGRHTGQYR